MTMPSLPPPNAIALDATLKRSANQNPSLTDRMLHYLDTHGVPFDVQTEHVPLNNFNIEPGVTSVGARATNERLSERKSPRRHSYPGNADLVMIHPSYLLRLRAETGFDRERSMFLKELAKVAEFERAAKT
ncbi:hypothetical protein Brsp06_04814 [Brucella sp. NBRC 13694]|uniref:hypothetical protein n=1 Tax=Brucella sp. NBRC 13694 TaxID=3075482 RepID=UPI0028AC7D7A|nr:hypothetical protein [Brucella anthropi]